MPNGVFNFRASWKPCSPDEDEETEKCRFSRARDIPKAPGTYTSSTSPSPPARFHHSQWAPSLPARLKREATWWKRRTRVGWAGRACLCLLHTGVSRETDWRSISLPVRGEILSQEGSDIVNSLWFFPRPTVCLSPLSPLSEPTFQSQCESGKFYYLGPFKHI